MILLSCQEKSILRKTSSAIKLSSAPKKVSFNTVEELMLDSKCSSSQVMASCKILTDIKFHDSKEGSGDAVFKTNTRPFSIPKFIRSTDISSEGWPSII